MGLREEQFWSSLERSSGCWLWTGHRLPKGYGRIKVNKRRLLTHRLAWELTHGAIPDGLYVLHNCPNGDNPACCNPAHLFLGTKGENNTDRACKGRNGDFRGERHPCRKLSADDVRWMRFARLMYGTPYKSLAAAWGVNFWTVRRIVTGRSWKVA